MDGGPVSTIIAESQEVGCHKVTPETRQREGNRLALQMNVHIYSVFMHLCIFVSYSFKESRPWVMTPVNSVSLRASISNQWILSSEFAHHAPPLMSSSSSEP